MGAKMNNFQGFFAQKLKFHFLDRPSFNINSTFPWVELRNSGSLIPLKDRVAEKGVSDLFQYTKKGQEALQLWSGQSYSPSQKVGHGKGNYCMCCSASWQVSQTMRLLGPCSIHSPFRGINLSFFLPVHPLLFTFGLNTFEISVCSVTFGWNQLLDFTVVGRDGQKSEGTESMVEHILPNQA